MKETIFSLKPFQQEEYPQGIELTGAIGRDKKRFTIQYQLKGPLDRIIIPACSYNPSRMERIWEGTCFELFLAMKDCNIYWEFNMSPSGDWNVYRFNNYREGMRQEKAFKDLHFRVNRLQDILALALEFEPEKIIPKDKIITISVAAVLKSITGRLMYFALKHQGTGPDFHRRDGFLIELNGL